MQSAPVSCIDSCTKQGLHMISYMKLWWLWLWSFTMIQWNADNFCFFIRRNKEHVTIKKKKGGDASIRLQSNSCSSKDKSYVIFFRNYKRFKHTKAKTANNGMPLNTLLWNSTTIFYNAHQHLLRKRERHCTTKTIQKFTRSWPYQSLVAASCDISLDPNATAISPTSCNARRRDC